MRYLQKLAKHLVVPLVLAVTPTLVSAQSFDISHHATQPQTANPGVAPPNSSPEDTTYARWSAAWVQWFESLHASNPLHPFYTASEVDCSYAQSGKVWFLVGAPGRQSVYRSCRVPAGTRLFFPLLNAWADNIGNQPPLTLQELKNLVGGFIEAGELHASIDGKPLVNLFAYRFAYAPFAYVLPATDNMQWPMNNYIVPGVAWPSTLVSPTASDGYWLMLEPLSVGPHTISFGGTTKNGWLAQDVTYLLDVEAKGRF